MEKKHHEPPHDDYSVAYWYQVGPHRLRAPLPPVGERVPRLVNTEGPTVGKP